MVLKEFRICMPMTVAEYQRGQLYMISRHSDEQSESGEGVEVIKNEPCCHEEYGNGQYTEKKIHLNKRLPSWAASFFPTIAVTEKAQNFYPYTITEYEMQSRVTEEEFSQREVTFLDIANDKVPDKHYKESEDCTKFKSRKTGRGPLKRDWMLRRGLNIALHCRKLIRNCELSKLMSLKTETPIMCSYKLVHVKFEVWGMQTKVENYILRTVRDILLLGHRQAFAWIDTWYDMTFESIRNFEHQIQTSTNEKVRAGNSPPKASASARNLPQINHGGASLPSRNSSTF